MGRRTHHDEPTHVPIFAVAPHRHCSRRRRDLHPHPHCFIHRQLWASRRSRESIQLQDRIENPTGKVHRRKTNKGPANEGCRHRTNEAVHKGLAHNMLATGEVPQERGDQASRNDAFRTFGRCVRARIRPFGNRCQHGYPGACIGFGSRQRFYRSGSRDCGDTGTRHQCADLRIDIGRIDELSDLRRYQPSAGRI